MPTVSVIIPTYRHATLVSATLASVFGQSFNDYEVIVVNDGSPDDTAAVLRPFAEAGRIRYVAQANAGQAAARNRGLVEAAGEFVAFLDDDDAWPTDKLAWQVDALRRNPDWVAVGGTFEETADGSPTAGPNPFGKPAAPVVFAPRDLFRGSPFASPGQVLIRATALRTVSGFDPNLWGTDDYDLWFRLAAVGPLVRMDRPSLAYRVHCGNASTDVRRMLGNVRYVIGKHIAALPQGERLAARRDADRWVYGYLGRRLLFPYPGAGPTRPVALWAMARTVAGTAVVDPYLSKMIAGDLARRFMPGAVWRVVRMVLGRPPREQPSGRVRDYLYPQ